MLDHTGVAVLEGRWNNKSNISMRNLFELIADLSTGNPNCFHYEMAGCEAAAKEAIPRIASYRKCKYLCIATHGYADGLVWHNDERLSRAELRNLLRTIEQTPGSTLDGIYMSACDFGTESLANFIFQDQSVVWWIAGYSSEINWVKSSALDLLFFNELMSAHIEDQRRGTNRTPVQKIQDIASDLRILVPELIAELGFGIYVRRQRVGGAKNLLAPDGDDTDQ